MIERVDFLAVVGWRKVTMMVAQNDCSLQNYRRNRLTIMKVCEYVYSIE